MDTIILILFGLTIAAALVVTLVTVLRSRRSGGWGGSDQAERTPQQKERDSRTMMIWGCLALAVPAVLVLAYMLTR